MESSEGIWRGAGSDDLDQRLLALLRVDRLAEALRGEVEIDAARTARHGRADGAGDADADVARVQHAERRLAERLGDRELVHLLVVALLEVDDLALGRARDQDHREAVGRGVRERGQAVEEARRRHREADARLLREKPGDGRRVARVLLVPERDHPHALGLGQALGIPVHGASTLEALALGASPFRRSDDEAVAAVIDGGTRAAMVEAVRNQA